MWPERLPPPTSRWVAALCFLIPPVAATARPGLVTFGGGIVLLVVLVPAMTLTYRASLEGAIQASVAGTVSLLLSAWILDGRGMSTPGIPIALGSLLLVSAGAGVGASLLVRSRLDAEERALSDPGTGLPNRRHALLHLERGFAAAVRGIDLAVVLFDLDHFKRINDSYGHATGDEVLIEFGRIISHRTREMNLSARVGGEEFLTILERCDEAGALHFAEDIRTRLAAVPFTFGRVTASAGIALFEEGMASPDVLVAAADQALYRAKREGRNRVAVWGSAREDPEYTAEIPRLSEKQPGAGELLLLVDDDDDVRRSVGRGLRRLGFEILEIASPEEALKIVRGLESRPDLLITDVMMPSMSGFRLVEEMTRVTGPLRVLYMSGYVAEQSDWEGAPGQLRAYLEKPVALDRLSVVVREMLDEALDEGKARVLEAEKLDPSDDGDAPILVTASDPATVPRVEVRLRHLGYDRMVGAPLADLPDVRPDFIVAWIEPPFDRAIETIEDFRARWPLRSRPPLLIIADVLPPEIAARWAALFPAVYLSSEVGLNELGLHVQHLREIQTLRRWEWSQRSEMEGRIAARTAELESALRDLLVRLARAGELKDDITGLHAERVGAISGAIAREMGLPTEAVSRISQAAPLHDLGKIAIPDSILNKPSRLTDTERDLMRLHTEVGARLLGGSRYPLLREAEIIARSHHEHWDGRGYPDGLVAKAIPLSARIVSVADTFDCVTHARAYSTAASPDRALEILRQDSGTQFDPDVVRAFAALYRRGDLARDLDDIRVANPDPTPRSEIEIQETLNEIRRRQG